MLIRTLLRTVLGSNEESREQTRSTLVNASRADWTRAVTQLDHHRLVPLVWYAILRSGLEEAVPDDVVAELKQSSREVFVSNAHKMYWLSRILSALEEADITPVVLKGAALANTCYPDLSMRVVGDLDLLIDAADREKAERALEPLAFRRRPGSRHAGSYVHESEGVELDLHHRFDLFERLDRSRLIRAYPSRFLDGSSLTAFDPNAMLVHLVVHLNEHRLRNTGYHLAWILDLAFVLREWGSELDEARVIELLPSRQARFWLLRATGFLDRELGHRAPGFLADAARGVEPYTLAETLRSRRLVPWGLPGPRGWVRLAACLLGLREKRNRPSVRPGDPLLALLDRAREQYASWRLSPGDVLPWSASIDRTSTRRDFH